MKKILKKLYELKRKLKNGIEKLKNLKKVKNLMKKLKALLKRQKDVSTNWESKGAFQNNVDECNLDHSITYDHERT